MSPAEPTDIANVPLAIALTGTSSTGKTTLARALMKDRRFTRVIDTLVPEGVRELLEALGHKSIDSMTLTQRLDFQRTYFHWKRQAESGLSRYLVDRSYVDIAAVCVERDGADQISGLRTEVLELCKPLAKTYDLHIYLPHGAIPFERDAIRSADLDLHARIGSRIEQYLWDWELPNVTLRTVALTDRVVEVCDAVESALACRLA